MKLIKIGMITLYVPLPSSLFYYGQKFSFWTNSIRPATSETDFSISVFNVLIKSIWFLMCDIWFSIPPIDGFDLLQMFETFLLFLHGKEVGHHSDQYPPTYGTSFYLLE